MHTSSCFSSVRMMKFDWGQVYSGTPFKTALLYLNEMTFACCFPSTWLTVMSFRFYAFTREMSQWEDEGVRWSFGLHIYGIVKSHLSPNLIQLIKAKVQNSLIWPQLPSLLVYNVCFSYLKSNNNTLRVSLTSKVLPLPIKRKKNCS